MTMGDASVFRSSDSRVDYGSSLSPFVGEGGLNHVLYRNSFDSQLL